MKEYQVIELKGKNKDDYTRSLNSFSKEGWELKLGIGKNNWYLVLEREYVPVPNPPVAVSTITPVYSLPPQVQAYLEQEMKKKEKEKK